MRGLAQVPSMGKSSNSSSSPRARCFCSGFCSLALSCSGSVGLDSVVDAMLVMVRTLDEGWCVRGRLMPEMWKSRYWRWRRVVDDNRDACG